MLVANTNVKPIEVSIPGMGTVLGSQQRLPRDYVLVVFCVSTTRSLSSLSVQNWKIASSDHFRENPRVS